LHHPHLVTIYDAGEDAGELFLVMELVDGESLAALIARRAPLAVDEAVSIAVQLLDGLSAVHADGVIHRDIKPANVLVDRSGCVRLTDFGIAKRLDEIEDHLTSSGMVVGTPTYLAPEQAVGGRLSTSTDIYLVGVVLYEMLTGARLVEPGLDPRRVRGDVPPGVAAAVARATDVDPLRRFATADDMIAALRAAPARSVTTAFPVAAAPTAAPTAVIPAAHRAAVAAATEIAPVRIDPVTPRPRNSGWWLLAAAATVAALIVGLLMIADAGPRQPDQPALTTTDQSTAPAAAVASAPPTTAFVSTAPAPAPPPEPAKHPGDGRGHAKKKPHPHG
jgi:serine/threonine-protein kinase